MVSLKEWDSLLGQNARICARLAPLFKECISTTAADPTNVAHDPEFEPLSPACGSKMDSESLVSFAKFIDGGATLDASLSTELAVPGQRNDLAPWAGMSVPLCMAPHRTLETIDSDPSVESIEVYIS